MKTQLVNCSYCGGAHRIGIEPGYYGEELAKQLRTNPDGYFICPEDPEHLKVYGRKLWKRVNRKK